MNDHLAWGPSALLTSNWDRLLQTTQPDGSRSKNILRIHGDTTDPTAMLLPSEISEESWLPQKHLERRRRILGAIPLVIAEAKFLCIYGLSLDPLDAELAYFVQTGIDKAESLKEIIVFNLPQERERLLGRIRMLADGKKVPTRFVDVSKPRPPGSGRF